MPLLGLLNRILLLGLLNFDGDVICRCQLRALLCLIHSHSFFSYTFATVFFVNYIRYGIKAAQEISFVSVIPYGLRYNSDSLHSRVFHYTQDPLKGLYVVQLTFSEPLNVLGQILVFIEVNGRQHHLEN